MKKIYLVLIVLVIAAVIGAVYVFSTQFSTVNYTSDLAKHLANAVEKGTLAAEYHGERRTYGVESVDSFLRVLRRGASEVKPLQGAPEHVEDQVTIYMDDVTLTVIEEDPSEDVVVLARTENGKTRYASLKDYAMMKWVLDVTGFAVVPPVVAQ